MKTAKQFAFLLVFLIAYLSASGQLKNYTDNQYQFSLGFPPDWSVKSFTDGADKVLDLLSPDENIAIQLRCFAAGADISSSDVAKLMDNEMQAQGAKQHSYSKDELNGIPGVMGVYSNSYDGLEVAIVTFSIVTNQTGYLLFTVIPLLEFENKINEADAVLNSFSLLKAKDTPVAIQPLQGNVQDAIANKSETKPAEFGNEYAGPCAGRKYVDYKGQKYRIISVGDQCWFSENLNVGTMLLSGSYQTDNNIVEKHCLNNLETNCSKYGGLYKWSEMMMYAQAEESQGICPPGWHIPTDMDWRILEGYADSELSVDDPIWEQENVSRGKDAARKLKSKTGWKPNRYSHEPGLQGDDVYGFAVLPAGRMNDNGTFFGEGRNAFFWTSSWNKTWSNLAFNRLFVEHSDSPQRIQIDKSYYYSVRCIRD
ncbi:MAG: hypothetical protein K9G67_03825 [Bacteroidales bacterium]|nr:hypothetical protein [Bacteroidales bacterium]MCF8349942.1 hypothetical protein [Bacteroidales bacterium]MCF8375459.1 hypothetical protein [Bacteroidales bacterium]